MIPLNLLFSMFKDGIAAMQNMSITKFSNETMMKIIHSDNGYLTCKYREVRNRFLMTYVLAVSKKTYKFSSDIFKLLSV